MVRNIFIIWNVNESFKLNYPLLNVFSEKSFQRTERYPSLQVCLQWRYQ